jgi:hypothetical protein
MTAAAPSWLATMRQITGTSAAADNDTIVGWARKIGELFPDMAAYCANYTTDTIAWCGLTAGYCMAINGVRPPFGATDTDRFLWAAAWQQFGTKADTPQPGDICVFLWSGGSDAGGHHVTMLEEVQGSSYVCRGGNQSHKVGLASFPASECIAVRRAPAASAAVPVSKAVAPIAYSGVLATKFGGVADPNTSAYDGHVITDTELGVSFPYRFPGPRPLVKVSKNGITSPPVPVIDVGPHYTNDPYFLTGSRPRAETSGASNKAGIDLTNALDRLLNNNGEGLVDFVFVDPQETVVTTQPAPQAFDINALAVQIAAMLRPAPPPPPPVTAAPQIDINALAAAVAAILQGQGAPAAPAPISALPMALPWPGPPQISLASTVAHVNAFMPILGTVLGFLPPPWNAAAPIMLLAQRGISAAVDVTNAVQTDPASVGGVINGHLDVISALMNQAQKDFPAMAPFATMIANVVKGLPAPAHSS